MPPDTAAAFELDHFFELRRVEQLVVSPDGARAIVSVATLAPDRKRFRRALWQIDLDGRRDPRRLTRSDKGEAAPAFLPDGSLLFTSERPDPDAAGASNGDDGPAGLWLLPPEDGEARLIAAPSGGISSIKVARDSGRIALAIRMYPRARSLDHDAELDRARKDAGVAAQLFDRHPIRYWDHYIGPRDVRYFVADPPSEDERLELTQVLDSREVLGFEEETLRGEPDFDISPDGSTLVVSTPASGAPTRLDHRLLVVDVESKSTRRLDDDVAEYGALAISPDGRTLACTRQAIGTPAVPGDVSLVTFDLTDGSAHAPTALTPGLDLAPTSAAWSAAGDRVFFTADEQGFAPVFSVTTRGRRVTRLTTDGAYTSVQPLPRGSELLALRARIDAPAEVARLAAKAPDQDATIVPSPADVPKVPGRLVDVVATTDDGVPIRSWLVLPDGASRRSPAPLVLWIHGGPVSSWNSWSWRWNPWLLAERGYAVLLPDPALSTGYGIGMIERGYGWWGETPYTDLMVATDAACARDDIDETRTAAMGGSFGGYMANWVAGHTDRFDCIVTHASLWALDQFHGTTDGGPWWELEFGDPYTSPERYIANSPNRHVGDITTPMLVIHGELDYRVPIGEALRLWTDLQRNNVESKFLYFPDENHWVLKPQNSRVWYETVFAWLDKYVLGKRWRTPELL